MALHTAADDPSRRHLGRMRQAVRVLYGSASPSEVFQPASLQVQATDVRQFLRQVAHNAADAGIAGVVFEDDAQTTPPGTAARARRSRSRWRYGKGALKLPCTARASRSPPG